MDGTVWDDHKAVWSPEAPDSVWAEAGRLRADPLRLIRQKCPMSCSMAASMGWACWALRDPCGKKDPRIVKAKGERPWFD
jgi:hypothetical protein